MQTINLEITLEDFLRDRTKLDQSTITNALTSIKDKYKEITVKKGDFLLQPGEVCHHSFYVQKGLLRYYSVDSKGKEHILNFAPEGWFVTDRDSMYYGQPTIYFTEALEDSTIILLDKDFFTIFSSTCQSFIELNERLLQNHIRHLQKRITQLLSATAEERYVDFVRIYPNIMARVPQWMVASYLGIAPESLSRVRKDLANKWKKSN
ncbi:MAG TPA: Crp/Fnr family transcriptional regulator [Taishania sp.]|nr:Crp/Fnr family transcriptional regulator [Taishania sp.]